MAAKRRVDVGRVASEKHAAFAVLGRLIGAIGPGGGQVEAFYPDVRA